MIKIDQVTKSFNGTPAVDGVSVRIPGGCVYGLLGPNGAGKTTTIRMMVDIYRPDSGSIELFGEPPGLRIQHRIGYLPEERGLYRKMKVLDQLVFLAELKHVPAHAARKRALEYLEKFGLSEWSGKKVEQLSKGMQQKVQFIGTILHDPDLLILDEPFSGLDPVNQALLKEEIQGFVRKNRTVIFSTHVLPQAEKLCEEICLINRGKKVLEGSVASIKEEFSEPVYIIDTDAERNDLLMEGYEVKEIEGHYEVRCAGLKRIEPFMERILQRGMNVKSFRPKEMDLEQIFIRVVKDDDR